MKKLVALLAALCLLASPADSGTMMMMGVGGAHGTATPGTQSFPIFISSATLPTTGSTTQFVHLSSGDTLSNINSAMATVQNPQYEIGTFSGLTVTMADATGAAATPTNPITATIYKNGTTTGYTCTVSGTNCSCPVAASCGASAPTVAQGDLIAIGLTTTGWTATQLYAAISLVKQDTNAAEWFSNSGSVAITTSTAYWGVNANQSTAVEAIASSVMPVAGSVNGYTVSWTQTPTASVFTTAQLCYNGVCSHPCAGWNGTAAVNPCTVTFTQAFSANDTISLQMVPTGTNNTNQKAAISYTPTTSNQTILATAAQAAMANTNPYSINLAGLTTPMVSTATPVQTFGSIPNNGAGLTFSQLTAYEVNTVPTRAWTFQEGAQSGGAPTATAITCTNSSSATTVGGSLSLFGCTDATHTVVVASGASQPWANWSSLGPATNTGASKISGVAVLTPGSAPPSTVYFPPLDMLSPVVGGLN